MNAHEIDYRIIGSEMQCVEVHLDQGESVIAEAGSFMMMDPDIRMETIFGDGSNQGGGGLMGKLMGAGKRLLTGEGLFMTVFTNAGYNRQAVTFASPYPGKIVPLDLQMLGGKIICQKDAFLCAAKGVSVGIEFQRKLGTGFFGGEGFIMQKIEGDGLAFVHSGGLVIERDLAPGEVLRLDTGCLVAMTSSVNYDIEFVKGVKTALFGGEGLFFATLRGPGKVWVQSLPFSRLADRVLSASRYSGRKDEGSLLGGLGNLLDGR
ncbi:TIGR00266 family protein [Paenibacillus timonensis]|uniref:TIGR00266 family protein n=1 Tax=Paenibacillus timonensis TaxID=225915 RepID=UPI003F94A253